jgi:ABC-2 type transport system ATP-binding protein
MVNSAIECVDLLVVRGGVEVLHRISVSVSAGTVTGLLGPSGCGKTTLMRAIVGTQIVKSGRVTVLGRPAGHPALRTDVGYGTPGASVYGDLTVRENLRYFGAAVGAPAGEVDRVPAQVDMTDFADRLTARLSDGQRSRVSLAVALIGRPRLIVLDEPTVGLDPVLREHLWTLFHELVAGGLTLLVSSHVMDEAERCDELILMRDGDLLAQASPSALKAQTGAASMDAAFLKLITAERAA